MVNLRAIVGNKAPNTPPETSSKFGTHLQVFRSLLSGVHRVNGQVTVTPDIHRASFRIGASNKKIIITDKFGGHSIKYCAPGMHPNQIVSPGH